MKEEQRIIADELMQMYPIPKTLRFELIPMGRTQEYIEQNGIVETDIIRTENYKKVKKIIDRYHKHFIDQVLADMTLNELEKYRKLYLLVSKSEKEEREFAALKAEMRKQITKKFEKNPYYKQLFKEDMLSKLLPEFVKDNEEEKALIQQFDKFSTYFTGFFKVRKNLYSDQEMSSAVAYRIVHQNLPKYIDNMKNFSLLCEVEKSTVFSELLNNLKSKFQIESIQRYFELDTFSEVLTQEGIELYNTILGGLVLDDNTKIKGLNEYINLYNQDLPKNEKKLPLLKPLFKQILSDRERVSFIPEQFQRDEEVLQAIKEFYLMLQNEVLETDAKMSLRELLNGWDNYDTTRIYVSNDAELQKISQFLFLSWSYIRDAISQKYDKHHAGSKVNTEAYIKKKEKELKQVKRYSLYELNCIIDENKEDSTTQIKLEDYFAQRGNELQCKIKIAYAECEELLKNGISEGKELCKNQKAVELLKNLLDDIKELQWLLKPLSAGLDVNEKDELFYGEFVRIMSMLDEIVILYNKVRNYVTKKPYSMEKVKLNFARSTLLAGWDKNKEMANLGIILEKDGKYYLGIMNSKNNKEMEQIPKAITSQVYRKMVYKLLPGANKMLPKVFFSKARIEEFSPSQELLDHYEKGTHKLGENFSLQHCHALIDFFKQSLERHEDWSQFGFHFTDTKKYTDISGFYREVEQQGYKITFQDIDVEYIDNLVEKGKLYLFQIYNKDFSQWSKGIPNLHTLYWKMLFSPENLSNVVYKLNGEAEIFFRKASIIPEKIITHEPEKAIQNKSIETWNKKEESTFSYELIKDRRYTVDKYQFHVPITLNFKAAGVNRLNSKVNKILHDWEADELHKELHIIGIDRGERNLLYISVIDMQGRIKKQLSLNLIATMDKNGKEHIRDYHMLLEKREKENMSARKNWQTINSIKELKEGYLSQAIHVITKLMVEYNGIVVLEDLNFGFKRSRQKVEKQVYQKFEKMLIDKLNYLVDKQKKPDENGGLLKAYQLTEQFESFQKMGKQSGMLYYVQPWNTSKLDPTTGFVNLFDTRYKSREETRIFIQRFDKIIYNQQEGYFEFSFDYLKFTYKAEGSRSRWTVCTHGERCQSFRNHEKADAWEVKHVKLTKAFCELFDRYHINWKNKDIRDDLISVEEADFYQAFMRLFALTVQMRNSDNNTGEDKIVSPVLNAENVFFETDCAREDLPKDADANGAYNIAKKGLMLITKLKQANPNELQQIKLAVSNKEWLRFAQEYTL